MSSEPMYHLPPATDPPTPPSRRAPAALWIIAGALVGLIGLAGLVLFAAGEDLFGSDDGTIDQYNQEVLQSCEIPDDWTLVRSYILVETNSQGDQVRSMSIIWASPLPPADVAAYFEVDAPGVWTLASADRSCKFGQRPSVLVLGIWLPGQSEPQDRATQTSGLPALADDEFWGGPGAEITDISAVPGNARSFVLLRLGQRVVEGLFGLTTAETPT